MKHKVLGIGSALVDILTRIEDESVIKELSLRKGCMTPVDAETSKKISKALESISHSMASGGSAANTIHAMGKLGVPVGFISVVGDDALGDFFGKDMNEAYVTSYLTRSSDQPTGVAITLVTDDSERTFATCLGASTQLSNQHLLPSIFAEYDYLYIEGYLVYNRPLMLKAIELAKANNMTVILDTASPNVVADNRDFLDQIITDVDIIFANEEEAKTLTGLEPEQALQSLAERCKIAIVKVGCHGSLVQSGKEIIRIGTGNFHPIDTTGAGDLYAAGFLSGLLDGKTLEQCGQLGSLLAGNVIEVIGPKMNQERWNTIYSNIENL